ncbi:MAG: ABC transporter C-terminal domain-containing protein, partial [Acidobacteriaceae bacterium]
VHVYTGNYEDYLWQISRQAEAAAKTPSSPDGRKSNENSAPAALPDPSSNGQPADSPVVKRVSRINPIRLRQMQDRCTALEEEIPRMEAAIQTTEEQLGVYVSAEHYQSQQNQLDQMRAEHAAMLTEWEELVTQLEEQAAISSSTL